MSARTVEITCTVDIAQTLDSLHAHAIPEGIDIRPGDVVVVHDAPTHVDYGQRRVVQCRATVTRAGLLGRLWAQVSGFFDFAEMYEVGFAPKETR